MRSRRHSIPLAKITFKHSISLFLLAPYSHVCGNCMVTDVGVLLQTPGNFVRNKY